MLFHRGGGTQHSHASPLWRDVPLHDNFTLAKSDPFSRGQSQGWIRGNPVAVLLRHLTPCLKHGRAWWVQALMLYRLQSDVWSVSLEIFDKLQEHLSGKKAKGGLRCLDGSLQAQYLIAFSRGRWNKMQASPWAGKPMVAGSIFNELGALGGLFWGHRGSHSPRPALTTWAALLGSPSVGGLLSSWV